MEHASGSGENQYSNKRTHIVPLSEWELARARKDQSVMHRSLQDALENTAQERLEHIDPAPKTFKIGTSCEKPWNRGISERD
jgi:hypothetical protein